ncbi:MAG TPA: penicillin-binding protein 2 [Thermoanaerobaculia bacterium]|jgi:penicillin-binding protein 2|nr:penicillin-binding protein 2 [Thermoanaerobaculia bacterium]
MLRIREDRQAVSRRIEIGRVAVGALLSILAVAYWSIQIVRGEYYFSLSENNRIRAVKITAPRGYVLDRNGAPLVENEPAYTLHLYRREAKDLDASVEFIVTLLGLNRDQVRSRVERGRRDPEFVPIPIAENLGIEEVAAVEARAVEHPEFAITVSQRRLYKHGGSAAHALGYLSEATPEQIKSAGNVYGVGDWIGQKGIESAYERLLAGASGERRVIVDSHGREVAEEARLEATPGQNLFLTLDSKLQGVAEDFFRERVGSAVALDPRTGEILALVSSPSYDPNWFTRRVTAAEWNGLLENPDRPLQNRAIQNMYSPGSVIKPFLAYGALARGLVDPDWKVFCPGHAVFYGREFHCHKKGGHGLVNLRDAIKESCDVYFYNLGQKLGVDRINEILSGFGFGSPTGVDLSFEKSGLVPSEEWARTRRGARWYPSETISVSIGQGPLLVTSMQVARALSALVEGGRLPTPHLFYSSQDPKTGSQLRYKAEYRQGPTLEPEKLAIVKNAMWAVVNEPGGTAYGSRVASVEIGGKTGTAQVIGHDSTVRAGADKSKLETHAWFAGFGPIQDPSMVVVVFVENGGHGNLAAAPLAKALFEARFGVAPAMPPAPAVQAEAPARGGLARASRREAP